jgi:hypothetical protein
LGLLFSLYYLKNEGIVSIDIQAKTEEEEQEEADKFKRLRSKTGFIVK